MTNHLVIPDVQAEAGTPTDHLKACGNYIVEHRSVTSPTCLLSALMIGVSKDLTAALTKKT